MDVTELRPLSAPGPRQSVTLLRGLAAALVLTLTVTACGSTVQTGREGPTGAAVADETSELELGEQFGAEMADETSTALDEARGPDDTEPADGEGDIAVDRPRQPARTGGDPSDSDAAVSQPDPSGTTQPAPPSPEQRTGSPEPLLLGYVTSGGNPGEVFGMEDTIPSAEATRRWIRAMVEEINETGGVAGRPVEVVFATVEQTDQSQATQVRLQEQACVQFTQDENVFMVFGTSHNTDYAQQCYANARTPLFSSTSGGDSVQRARFQPWVLPGFGLALDRIARLFPISLDDQDLLDSPIGIISFDTEPYRRSVEEVLVPGLEARGGDVRETVFMRIAYQDIAAQISSAVLRFRSEGIDRVIVLADGGGAWLLFSQQAESQGYRPAYTLSSLDRPWWIGDQVPPGQRERVHGVGWWMTLDTHERAQPEPTQKERDCWRIFNERAGTNFQNRSTDAINAMAICENFFLLRAALAPATGRALEQGHVPDLYHALAANYDPIQFESVLFGRDRADAVSMYADMTWDVEDCNCMRYTSPWRPLPFP